MKNVQKLNNLEKIRVILSSISDYNIESIT